MKETCFAGIKRATVIWPQLKEEPFRYKGTADLKCRSKNKSEYAGSEKPQ
jgi:hypothetical protein